MKNISAFLSAHATRAAIRRGCFIIFWVGVILLSIATPMSDQLKATYTTPKYPILVSLVALGVLFGACISLFIGICLIDEPSYKDDSK